MYFVIKGCAASKVFFSPRSDAKREIELTAVEKGSDPRFSLFSSVSIQTASSNSTSVSISTRAGKNLVVVSVAFLRAAGISADKDNTTSIAEDLVPGSNSLREII